MPAQLANRLKPIMKRETKIGILALVTIAVIVVGFNFLKGKEVFSSANTYYVVYDNVDQLSVGDGVRFRGLRVGQVASITLDEETAQNLTVGLTLEEDLPVPTTATVLIKADGLLGGRFITLVFDAPCSGDNCATDGTYLTAASETMLEGLLGDPEDLKRYAEVAKDAAGPIVDSIAQRLDTNGVGRTMRNLETTTQNLARLTEKIDRLLARSGSDLSATVSSVASITKNLETNNAQIASILRNVDSTTSALARVDLGSTLTEVEAALQSLQSTLASSNGAISNLDDITAGLNRGEGSLGMLLQDDAVAVRLERTLTNLDLLMQDLRLNPKRYVNVSVFGKKQKEYDLPEEDPAEDILRD